MSVSDVTPEGGQPPIILRNNYYFILPKKGQNNRRIVLCNIYKSSQRNKEAVIFNNDRAFHRPIEIPTDGGRRTGKKIVLMKSLREKNRRSGWWVFDRESSGPRVLLKNSSCLSAKKLRAPRGSLKSCWKMPKTISL